MSFWGGWVPFIGWRTFYLDDLGELTDEKTDYKASCFCIEWLEAGILIHVVKDIKNG